MTVQDAGRPGSRTPGPKSIVWCDVEDLVAYAVYARRPSGIQRLACETYEAHVALAPERVRFVSYNARTGEFDPVAWPAVQAIYRRLASGTGPAPPPPEILVHRNKVWEWFRNLGRRWGLLSRSDDGPTDASAAGALPDKADASPQRPRAGDVICTLGAPWHHPTYAEHLALYQRKNQVRFALLVHDLIPMVRPEYFDASRAPLFPAMMRNTLPLADVLFTNSEYTARDVSDWTARNRVPLRTTPRAIPIGTGFQRPPPGKLPEGLVPGGYVLFVSTIEVRKNHLQAFRVWCRMLREMPVEQVPKLVFAGGVGWMVEDLMKLIANTDNLWGHLVVLHSPDDAELGALYANCRFTLFTSYYEGWGLPVSDSLAFGKVCISSERTAMPEAGGPFCLYVDPDNNDNAYRVIRQAIEQPATIEQMERRIREEFRPVEWRATAQAILDTLGIEHTAR